MGGYQGRLCRGKGIECEHCLCLQPAVVSVLLVAGQLAQESDRLGVRSALVVGACHEECRALPRGGSHGIEGADGAHWLGQHSVGQFPCSLGDRRVVHLPTDQEGRGAAVSFLCPFTYHRHSGCQLCPKAGE